MKIKAAISFYRTQVALAAALGVTQPCISNWLKRDKIPALQQLRLQDLTGLKADRSIMPKISRK